ncbi:MAG: HU family DNA-binding protein [Myxococcota bacterium]
MNWSEYLGKISEKTGISNKKVHAVMTAAVDVAIEELERGGVVSWFRLGALSTRWQHPRTLRQVNNHRKVRIDGRYRAHFRPAAELKRRLLGRTPQLWRSPVHQAAWQLSEALIGDLQLYHKAQIPTNLTTALSDAEIRKACATAFGPLWAQIDATYQQRIDADVRDERDYLAEVIRQTWIRSEADV